MRKGQKKGISPVIATIILIAVALVLALIVGVFAFGLFSSNTHNITVKSATLYASPSVCQTANTLDCLVVSINNPGTPTTITAPGGITLGTSGCIFAADTGTGTAVPNGITKYVYAVTTACGVQSGAQYDLTLTLGNTQTVTSVVVAQ